MTRPFHLIRDTDVTGISGTGTVAAGVIWDDGTVSMRWLTYTASSSFYNSIEDVETIHGHQGATKVHFADDTDAYTHTFRITRRAKDSDVVNHVADGVQWIDDTVSVHWLGEHASTVYWKSLDDALAIHDHDGLTRFDFRDHQGK
jgi:hypothetical protein